MELLYHFALNDLSFCAFHANFFLLHSYPFSLIYFILKNYMFFNIIGYFSTFQQVSKLWTVITCGLRFK